jgi:hypothetical protein
VVTLLMYRFRYSPDGGEHWVTARYRELAPVIRMRHPDHRLLDCEIRHVDSRPDAMSMGRFAAAYVPPMPAPTLPKLDPANVQFDPELHERELKCARIFLQRYATWCVKKKRFGCAGGAANLSRRLRDQ